MRRLTLILSDLYLPEEAVRGAAFPSSLDLPNLDWLLRFAHEGSPVAEWRHWLATELGAPHLARLPVAQGAAQALLPRETARHAWFATPVHLEARLDHVRLADRGLLRLAAAEREAWIADFARSFGPDYALHDAGERAFLLSGAADARVATVDPARLLDADIGRALPSGPAAGELRRLGTEIEMWLHGAAPNNLRERSRQRRLSALWFWGGGAAPAAPLPARLPIEDVSVHGGDPYLQAFVSPLPPAPPDFAALDRGTTHAVVELSPMSGAASESLANLDLQWFAPARAALSDGTLQAADVVVNDRCFRIAARPAWRIWRRRVHWLDRIAASWT